MNGKEGASDRFRRRVIWVVLAMLLLGVLILQLASASHYRQIAARTQPPYLEKVLPAKLPGGRAHDEPIAATAEMKRAVDELLNYDEAIFRIYEQSGYRISIYIAWWRPGKMSPRLVASHTPDICWPQNGWQRERASEESPEACAVLMYLSGLLNGQHRIFSQQGKSEHVVFWHKVGDDLLDYKTEFLPPWWAVFDEIWRRGLNLREEQLFIRVSSDVPLSTVWLREDMQPLRSALQELGLRAGEKMQ